MLRIRPEIVFAAAVSLAGLQCTSKSSKDGAPPGGDAGASGAGTGGVSAGGGTSGTAGASASGGTAGASASGGTAGSSGSSGSGGAAGTGGSAGSGGAAGTGGSAGSGGAAGSGGSGGSTCSPGAPTGGWPDSATKLCSNGATVITCPTTGPLSTQDGVKQEPVPSYSVAGNEVTDPVTGLVWTKDYLNADDHAKVGTRCKTKYGLSWRLPSAGELSTLIDYGRPEPTIDQTFTMPSAANRSFWTSSSFNVTATTSHVHIDFKDGLVYDVGKNSTPRFGRCVKNDLVGKFTADPCGVVTDSKTRLMWPNVVDNGQSHNWTSALAYCDGFIHAGHEDWRVPTAKELLTIVKEGGSAPHIDTVLFGNTPKLGHWTSTPYQPDPSQAWFVDFNAAASGLVGHDMTTSPYPVRCVRDWKP